MRSLLKSSVLKSKAKVMLSDAFSDDDSDYAN